MLNELQKQHETTIKTILDWCKATVVETVSHKETKRNFSRVCKNAYFAGSKIFNNVPCCWGITEEHPQCDI